MPKPVDHAELFQRAWEEVQTERDANRCRDEQAAQQRRDRDGEAQQRRGR